MLSSLLRRYGNMRAHIVGAVHRTRGSVVRWCEFGVRFILLSPPQYTPPGTLCLSLSGDSILVYYFHGSPPCGFHFPSTRDSSNVTPSASASCQKDRSTNSSRSPASTTRSSGSRGSTP